MERPISPIYEDVYWTRGATEKRHVFVVGNALPERLAAWPADERFTVAELGFGTGLNAALVAEAAAQAKASVTFISYELHPLPAAELEQIHAGLPEELQGWLTDVRRAWPNLAPGWNDFTVGQVAVKLYIGDAQEGLASQPLPADAWFLDGFNPLKNPVLWSAPVLAEVARHSRPSTTVATYSVAREIITSLENVGFEV
jgi:tRNA U34 5-methylaminomethyl-2-thiouridine-forming methyltransferase MnmC